MNSPEIQVLRQDLVASRQIPRLPQLNTRDMLSILQSSHSIRLRRHARQQRTPQEKEFDCLYYKLEFYLTKWRDDLSLLTQLDHQRELTKIQQVINDDRKKLLQKITQNHPFQAVGQLSEDFNCLICLNFVRDPTECASCEKLFCTSCVEQWRETSNRCCHCKSASRMKQPNRLLMKFISKTTLKCGVCGQECSMGEADNHVMQCEQGVTLKCADSHDGCPWTHTGTYQEVSAAFEQHCQAEHRPKSRCIICQSFHEKHEVEKCVTKIRNRVSRHQKEIEQMMRTMWEKGNVSSTDYLDKVVGDSKLGKRVRKAKSDCENTKRKKVNSPAGEPQVVAEQAAGEEREQVLHPPVHAHVSSDGAEEVPQARRPRNRRRARNQAQIEQEDDPEVAFSHQVIEVPNQEPDSGAQPARQQRLTRSRARVNN